MFALWTVVILASIASIAVALRYLSDLVNRTHHLRTYAWVHTWREWIHSITLPRGFSGPEATVFQAVSGSDTALRTAAIAGTYTIIATIVAGGFALAAKSLELRDKSIAEAKASQLASESFAQWRASAFYQEELPRLRDDAVSACEDPKRPIDPKLGTRLAHILFAASSFGCQVPETPPAECRAVSATLRSLTFCEDLTHE